VNHQGIVVPFPFSKDSVKFYPSFFHGDFLFTIDGLKIYDLKICLGCFRQGETGGVFLELLWFALFGDCAEIHSFAFVYYVGDPGFVVEGNSGFRDSSARADKDSGTDAGFLSTDGHGLARMACLRKRGIERHRDSVNEGLREGVIGFIFRDLRICDLLTRWTWFAKPRQRLFIESAECLGIEPKNIKYPTKNFSMLIILRRTPKQWH
jgi:hypothetical protein